MNLIWNELEQGWECECCDALYSDDEVARMFGYNFQSPDNFIGGYCMDCGIKFEKAVKFP